MRRISIELDEESEALLEALASWLEQHPIYGASSESPLHLAMFTALLWPRKAWSRCGRGAPLTRIRGYDRGQSPRQSARPYVVLSSWVLLNLAMASSSTRWNALTHLLIAALISFPLYGLWINPRGAKGGSKAVLAALSLILLHFRPR